MCLKVAFYFMVLYFKSSDFWGKMPLMSEQSFDFQSSSGKFLEFFKTATDFLCCCAGRILHFIPV